MQDVLTAQDQDGTPRARLARLVLSRPFQRAVTGLILLNAVTLGLETWDSLMAEYGAVLHALDQLLLWVFTAELVLRFAASILNRLRVLG